MSERLLGASDATGFVSRGLLPRVAEEVVLREACRPRDLVALGVDDPNTNGDAVVTLDSIEAVPVGAGHVLPDKAVDVVVGHEAIVDANTRDGPYWLS